MRLRLDRQKQRQEEAAARQAAYNRLTIAQKIARLDEKLGTGVGAKKQRAKLEAALANPPKTKTDEPAKEKGKDKASKKGKGKPKSKSKYQQKKERQNK
jgi:hypothetical protein